ncbi:response regulator transcription factor [Paraflavisolibacter sp. H34]|uniref:response regulator transcription factor n=1 Tax=Huijunlia imazamoxiresistens TaxID=3127457 RepID=UPI003018A66D
MKLLIIEDEKELAENIRSYLENENYTCELTFTYNEALLKTEVINYDCIILDITLPDGSGLRLLQELKRNHKSDGVIIISAKNSIDDRIGGLQLGADDYLVKPFYLPELAARIAAIIRRKVHRGNNVVTFHEISIDTIAKQARVQDMPLELTRKEYQLLLYFLSNQLKVISKNALISHLWTDEMSNNETFDIIYTHIRNLRKKLQDKGCPDYIKSVYGMGYKLSDE